MESTTYLGIIIINVLVLNPIKYHHFKNGDKPNRKTSSLMRHQPERDSLCPTHVAPDSRATLTRRLFCRHFRRVFHRLCRPRAIRGERRGGRDPGRPAAKIARSAGAFFLFCVSLCFLIV